MDQVAAQAVVFDLDGTVWDSRPWYAWLLVGEDDGLQRRALAQLADGTSIAIMLRAAGITKAQFRTRCAEPGGCAIYPGVHESLQRLVDRGTQVAAATNLPGWIASPMLEGLGLGDLTGSLAHWGTTRRHKPRPDPLIAALRMV